MIDWSRVEEMIDEIGAEDFAEVVELFLDEVETAIDALDASAGNPVVTEEQMHFLKGAALNIGFATLAELCREGEKAAANGTPDKITPAQVRSAFEDSRLAFQRDLPGRLAA
ncbi:Hpt domain-containing protein [Mameliella sediminis]|uniref:Hpt domain-containing protein n=1 Tax=Mameliella sediminis TaxID=2836866 RepID=UPI001C43E9D2|nr:Hpt domain-containing protein [Mameliella sediminis]MBY6113994.1 Hpt domain-containing protein [Antarctobacter heliothermus]MBY6142658.1 Hpt domain-containing protein [Mameliella alba]MBV7395291.1 Hpt domain-containing protein [Mameliella sediminis]MBY6159513.1 Hpt domain-containing protein [Mameliella alba]MBY6167984.1 Hpt domain-containing protein [Mameliella alba]